MDNLLNCKGREFTAKIYDTPVKGRIQVKYKQVYLCQNIKEGDDAYDKLGYKYTWRVGKGTPDELPYYNVTDFKLLPINPSDYKDWQVGDRVTHESDTYEVIFRSGKLVIFEDSEGNACYPRTCDEMYREGYRLIVEPQETPLVEVTLDEIAKLKGVPVENLRIKE